MILFMLPQFSHANVGNGKFPTLVLAMAEGEKKYIALLIPCSFCVQIIIIIIIVIRIYNNNMSSAD